MSPTKWYLVLAFISSLYLCCRCDAKSEWTQKLSDLRGKAEELYSKVDKTGTKEWEYQLEDRLGYPRGDKWKLGEVSSLWTSYYECLVQLAESTEGKGALPAYSVMTYVGMSVTINCSICLSPEGKLKYEWWYSKDLKRPSYTLMDYRENAVFTDEGALSIYGASREDGGVYVCRLGASNGSRVYVEVVDEEELYIVAKPSSRQAVVTLSDAGGGVIVWNRPSAASECSMCGRVGRRRTLAVCTVTLTSNYNIEKRLMESISSFPTSGIESYDIEIPSNNTDIIISNETITLLKAFPDGIPCRSKLLPEYIKDEPAVRDRPSEIVINLCKEPCKENVIFEVLTPDGRVLEQANNSGGIYSMLQTPPPQPPPPARDILFMQRLEEVRILCPGSLFTDTPVRWRIGELQVVPRIIDKQSGGRVFVSARDQLVIRSLRLTDTGVYSCWQGGKLAGAVKLLVSERHTLHYNQHLTLLGLAVISAVGLRLAVRVLRNKRRNVALH